MNRRSLGALAAVAGALGLSVSVLLVRLVSGRSGVPEWLPSLGSPGETVAVYVALSGAVSTLVVVALGVGVGLLAVRRGVGTGPDGLRRVAVPVGAGATVGVVASVGVALAAVGRGVADGTGALVVAAGLLDQLARVALTVTVAAVAAAGLAGEGTAPGSGAGAATAGTDRPDGSADPGADAEDRDPGGRARRPAGD